MLTGTHIIANSSGVESGKLFYRPCGETRDSNGTPLTTWRRIASR